MQGSKTKEIKDVAAQAECPWTSSFLRHSPGTSEASALGVLVSFYGHRS